MRKTSRGFHEALLQAGMCRGGKLLRISRRSSLHDAGVGKRMKKDDHWNFSACFPKFFACREEAALTVCFSGRGE